MIAIGLGLAWAGYAAGIWGYCLVRGYDVTFRQCFAATWPGKGTAGEGTSGNALAIIGAQSKPKAA